MKVDIIKNGEVSEIVIHTKDGRIIWIRENENGLSILGEEKLTITPMAQNRIYIKQERLK